MYDGYGVCLREYIYIGAKMVADYQPQTGKYYYYTIDQIGSTRIVTDDAGNIVYAAAHDPYGGVQQTWVNTFNPELKFSGKEQDTESGLYYFGARYYDPTLYRFLSPDPVIPTDRALYDPQRWNLYAYCLGNPVRYVDLGGKFAEKYQLVVQRMYLAGDMIIGQISLILYRGGDRYTFDLGSTTEKNSVHIPPGEYIGKIEYSEDFKALVINLYQRDENGVLQRVKLSNGKYAAIHQGISNGCITTKDDIVKQLAGLYLTLEFSGQRAMTANQIGQVLWAFYELDVLSVIKTYEVFFMMIEIKITVLDPPKAN